MFVVFQYGISVDGGDGDSGVRGRKIAAEDGRNGDGDDVPPPAKRTTLSDTCIQCGGHVPLIERFMVDTKVYHRRCLREKQRTLSRSKERVSMGSSSSLSSSSSSQLDSPSAIVNKDSSAKYTFDDYRNRQNHMDRKQKENQQQHPPRSTQQSGKRKVQNNPFMAADTKKKEPDYPAEQPVKKPFLATVKKAEKVALPWEKPPTTANGRTPTANVAAKDNRGINTNLRSLADSQKDTSSLYHRPFMPKDTQDSHKQSKPFNSETVAKNKQAMTAYLNRDVGKNEENESSKNVSDGSKGSMNVASSMYKSPTTTSSAQTTTPSWKSSYSSSSTTTTTTTSSSSYSSTARLTTTTTTTYTSTTSSASSASKPPPFASGQKPKPLRPYQTKLQQDSNKHSNKPEVEVVGSYVAQDKPSTYKSTISFQTGKSETQTFHNLLDNLKGIRAKTSDSATEPAAPKQNGLAKYSGGKVTENRETRSPSPPPLPTSLPPSNKLSTSNDLKPKTYLDKSKGHTPRSVSPKPEKSNQENSVSKFTVKINQGKQHGKSEDVSKNVVKSQALNDPSKSSTIEIQFKVDQDAQKATLKTTDDHRSRPHKSILKPHGSDDNKPKSILKPHLDSSSRSRSSSPLPKPILKPSSNDPAQKSSPAHSRNASPRSILKTHEELFDDRSKERTYR